LESRGFIVSLGIDLYDKSEQSSQAMEGADKQNRYTVTAAMPKVMDMKENAVNDKNKIVKSVDSSSISGGIRLMDLASSQKLYVGQAKLLVFGKDLLSHEDLFRQAVDAMERDRNISRKLYLMSTKERAEGILKLNLPGEPELGLFVENYYKKNNGNGSFSFYKTLEKIISDLHSTGCTLIPEIKKRDKDMSSTDDTDIKEETGEIIFGGCAVIKDYQLAGWLDDEETQGYAWVIGNCRDSVITVQTDKGYMTLKVDKSKASIKFTQNSGKLECLIRVNVSGAIGECNSDAFDFNNIDNLQAYKELLEQSILKEITETAARLQYEMGADIYNFRDLLRKKNRQLYMEYGTDWEKYFREMLIMPVIKVDIISIGTII